MLTIEIRLNGETIAEAHVVNVSGLAEFSHYDVQWSEGASPDLGIRSAEGAFVIVSHRRRQTVWALAAKVVKGVLGQMIDRIEGGR